MKKREKYFKSTSCRDKRSIVRCLNTFSKKFEYILCNQTHVDLDFEAITFIYSDDEKYNSLNPLEEEGKNENKNKSIIFSKKVSEIELQNTKRILETIDNLISINRKQFLKESLKESVRQRDNMGLNSFFYNKDLSLKQMSTYITNEKFALKIYNQIKNRIMFSRSGIYTENQSGSTVKNRIKLQPTSIDEILELKIDYVLDNLWLFNRKTIERVEEVLNAVNTDKCNKHYSDGDTPNDNNTSLFHPIDEDVYLDPDVTAETRRSSMPVPMILREEYDMYDSKVYKDYDSYVFNYDVTIERVKFIIENLLERYDELISMKNKIINKIEQDDEYCYELFEKYIDEDDENIKTELLEYYPNFLLLHKFFSLHKLLNRIEKHYGKFSAILKLKENEALKEHHKFNTSIKINSYKQYQYFIDLQQAIMDMIQVKSLKELRNFDIEHLIAGCIKFGLGKSEDEIAFIVNFNQYDNKYNRFIEMEIPF